MAMEKFEWKRYLISSLYTFLTGFLLAILANLDSIDWSNLEAGALLGLMGAGLRGGIKIVGEAFLIWRDKKSNSAGKNDWLKK